MSYSLITKCYDCKKELVCTDRHILSGAISAIHSMPYGMGWGHQGYGTINLDCSAYEKKEEKADG